jgi:hypothetical protein
MTQVINKAREIAAWCERMNVKANEQQEMVKDYIDTRWPTLARHVRKAIFEAAMRHSN